MHDSTAADGMVRAILADEFDDLDTEGAAAVAAIRAGLLDDWVCAVADSGLLSADAVRVLEVAWRRDPELLVDALLDGADEVARRRLASPRGPALVVGRERVSVG